MVAGGVALVAANLTVLAFVLGLLAAGAGGVLAWSSVRSATWTYVYDRGVVTRTAARRDWRAFAWSELTHLGSSWTRRYVNGSYTGMFGNYVLYLPDGRKVSLTFNAAPQDVDKLPRGIESKVAAHLLPARIAELHAGLDVDFGAFRMGVGGIKSDGRSLAWSDITGSEVKSGVLTIRTRTAAKPLTTPVKKVLDFQVFSWLFDRAVEQPSWRQALAAMSGAPRAS
jgi:hypothetical protein